MYIYMYMHMYMYMCMYICICIHVHVHVCICTDNEYASCTQLHMHVLYCTCTFTCGCRLFSVFCNSLCPINLSGSLYIMYIQYIYMYMYVHCLLFYKDMKLTLLITIHCMYFGWCSLLIFNYNEFHNSISLNTF